MLCNMEVFYNGIPKHGFKVKKKKKERMKDLLLQVHVTVVESSYFFRVADLPNTKREYTKTLAARAARSLVRFRPIVSM